jgi:hypothetical protein
MQGGRVEPVKPGGWVAPGGMPRAYGGERAATQPLGWPSKDALDYTRALIVTGLLVLALPWLITTLLTRPGYLLAGLGRRAASP